MFQYLLTGLFIIVILCAIYWLFIRRTDEGFRRECDAALGKSAGVFDAGARMALDALSRVETRRPVDHFTRGHIIYHNILNGDINGARIPERRRMVQELARNYTDAIGGMFEEGEGTYDPVAAHQNQYMLRNIDMVRAGILLAGEVADDAILRAIAEDLGTAGTRGERINRDVVQSRAKNAVAMTTNRAAAVNKALDDATVYTNDRQNVHDTAVNADLRGILAKIRDDVDAGAAIFQAREYINSEYPGGKEAKANALRGLDTAAKGGYINTLNDSEDKIFAYVWERCKHPLNADKYAEAREAVINALADGVENGTQVCMNGRCARILGSLTTIDYDSDVADGVLTLEAYRNAIFQQTKQIVNGAIERAQRSDDAKLRAVGAAYESGDDPDGDDDMAFRDGIKEAIDVAIDAYADKLNENDLARVRGECYVYATL